jgi:hypothetical protein
MSKQDYELIAQALKESKPKITTTFNHLEVTPYEQWRVTVIALVARLKQQNPRFREAQFLQACEFETDYQSFVV